MKQNNIFIDIGNTNIKYVKNSDDKFIIKKINLFNLVKVLWTKNNLYILNVNKKVNWIISLTKLFKKNIYVFNENDCSDFHNYFEFDNKEVGYDLLLLAKYICESNSNYEDEILINIGTYSVFIVKHKNKVISVNIGNGLQFLNDKLNAKFKLNVKHVFMTDQPGITTLKSIGLNNYLYIQGYILGLVKNFDLKNHKITISGNGSSALLDNNEVLDKTKNYKIIPNLTLISFRNWCYWKFKITHN